MTKLPPIVPLIRCMGPAWLGNRLVFALRQRSGHLRRAMPCCTWAEPGPGADLADTSLARPEAYLAHRLEQAPPFFFDPRDMAAYRPLLLEMDQGPSAAVAEAEALAGGRMLFFRGVEVETGLPPRWHHNYLAELNCPDACHWSEIDDFAHGDIKVVWEPSRFSFTYALVRAYWRTGREEFAELFWRLVEDWRENNPPNRGPNWKCGQEAAVRLCAWCFGMHGFAASPATTGDRLLSLAQMAGVTAQRIERHIGFALSQQNNHGMAEAMGLLTAGLVFPELAGAPRWRQAGIEILARLAGELIYADGTFAQHSVNYHRVMLHYYLWSLRLARLNRLETGSEVWRRVGAAVDWLWEMTDGASGRAPCHGADDGALPLPLADGAYHDQRPTVQAGHYLIHGSRRLAPGPWDESLLWLFGPQALDAPQEDGDQSDMAAREGGYYTLRGDQGWAMVRCGRHRHRPSHADLLHVDLWWQGCNLALDPGTYSYNAPPPWDNALGATAFHNTVTVDGLSQMDQAGRFLWLPWPEAGSLGSWRSDGASLACWQGRHEGYARLPSPVRHHRALAALPGGIWLVVDRLAARDGHQYRLHWLAPDCAHQWRPARGELVLNLPPGAVRLAVGGWPAPPRPSLVRADPQSPRGWRAPGYLQKEPALSASWSAQGQSQTFWSIWGPGQWRCEREGSTLGVGTPRGLFLVKLSRRALGPFPLIEHILWEDSQGRPMESLACTSC